MELLQQEKVKAMAEAVSGNALAVTWKNAYDKWKLSAEDWKEKHDVLARQLRPATVGGRILHGRL